MSTWKDQLGRVDFAGKSLVGASFRGVAFYVAASTLSGGRRGVLHEFPGRDTAQFEDLGRKARTFPVDGYVLGADYMADRRALQDALDAAGPGELRHPYHGTRTVACTSYSVRETARDGGMAAFQIDFTETAETLEQPAALVDPATLISTSADTAADGVSAEFLSTYTVDGLAPNYLESLEAVVEEAAEAIDDALAPVTTETQALALLRQRTALLAANAAALVRAPEDAVDALLGVLDVEAIGSGGAKALLAFYAFVPATPAPSGTGAKRAQEAASFAALQKLLRGLAVVQAGRLTAGETFDSYDAAVLARDAVTDAIDTELELVGDDAYPGLVQLRADLATAVPGDDSDLPRLVQHTAPATVPSLVLAHQLYGDVTREEDVLARNAVRHPGFIVGGEALEVLSDG